MAIDTFRGFTPADVRFEVAVRGKRASELGCWRINRKRWFEHTMRREGCSVVAYQADIAHFDLAQLRMSIAFCLIDVDLYQPVRAALERVLPRLDPGGIVIVDDAQPDTLYDGAYQAYREVVKGTERPEEILFGKLGVIRAPARREDERSRG